MRTRSGSTVVVPSAPNGGSVGVPGARGGCGSPGARRSTCAWSPTARPPPGTTWTAPAPTCTTWPAGWPSLLAAGGAALTADGAPVVLEPDTGARIRFVAAADEALARTLLDAVA